MKTEEAGRLQSMGSQRLGHNELTNRERKSELLGDRVSVYLVLEETFKILSK